MCYLLSTNKKIESLQENIDPAYCNHCGRLMSTLIRFFGLLYPSFYWLLSCTSGLRGRMLNIGPLQPIKKPGSLTLIIISLPVVDATYSASGCL